ncbi:sensor histidine kinase [Arthrobacter castelli]|uniref:sensor histidine kinase n=1 Tax=Arthrobacter castelli TaxID=271431 RepID=UPI0003FBE5F9|nr:ATP-binding protein [Arthrobacter castelli]
MNKDRFPLRLQLLGLQVFIVLALVSVVLAFVVKIEADQIRETTIERVRDVATQTASLPVVVSGLQSADPPRDIAPVAKLVADAAGVDYVVVVDMDGIRAAHPDPGRIGEHVSSNHEDIRQGGSFVGVQEGPVGVTLRAKVPVYDGDTIVGTVSVGILESRMQDDLQGTVAALAPWTIGAVVLGVLAAAWVTRMVRRRIFGLEPSEIASLMQSNEALLHSVRDGVVAVDPQGRLGLINDEASRLLGIGPDVVGRPASEVLDDDVVALLQSSEPTAEEQQYVLAGERVLLAARSDAWVDGRHVGRTLALQDRTELESTLRDLAGQRSTAEMLRSQTHEFSNRLHIVSGLLDLGEVDELRRYIGTLTGSDPEQFPDSGIADPSLAALINAKSAVAREAGVTLTIDPESTVEDSSVDDDTLTVLANLITNATEAAGAGGEVLVKLALDCGGSTMTVGDTGPGVADDQRGSVFTRGFSTKSVADNPQRGIGLALIQRIAARRGGSAHVGRSALGGAEFIVNLPAER